MTTPPRILILTAGFGEGHNAAARALAQAFEEESTGSALVVDLFALTRPRVNRILRWGYLKMINTLPGVWSRVYRWMDTSRVLPRWSEGMGAERRRLARLLDEERPTALCCTFPVYPYLLRRLEREGRVMPPIYTIVTDSISINSLWWKAESDGWFLPNEDSAAVMRRAGVDSERLFVSGFPVNLFFAHQAGTLSPESLSGGHAPRILYIINSGTANAEETARLLLAEESWEITCAVGRDERLRKRLSDLASGRKRPATILGWTDQIPQLLMTHHAVVSKAGGATTQEAIAARCPMIVNQIVPGQEEGNFELLRRHKAGVLAPTPGQVMAALRGAFSAGSAGWQAWRSALVSLARPEAARTIACHVLSGRPEPTEAALSPSQSAL